jgi:hypothetical protein
MDLKIQDMDSPAPPLEKRTKSFSWLDVGIVVVMCALLYYGASWQIFSVRDDAAKYQCYAVAFWQGVPALRSYPPHQCDNILHPSVQYLHTATIVQKMQKYGVPAPIVQFVASQSADQPLHSLPHEYPLLTVIPFTLGLIAPMSWYQVAFAIWMLLLAAVIYFALVRFRSRQAGIACVIYLLAGSWATAAGRFDLVSAALTLFAVVCAARKRWNWGFVFLALATLFKFYPVVLLIPFLITRFKEEPQIKWFSWRKLQPLATYVAVCVFFVVLSLALSVEGTLGPLSYFGNRPIQVESLPASLVWLESTVRGHTLHYIFTYGSLNIKEGSTIISMLSNVLLLVGFVVTYWLQWRGKIDLATASLMTLLIIMITGKVFSPQYLIWVAPLVAYVGEMKLRWLIPWTLISLLTTLIYPYIYDMVPLLKVPYVVYFFPTTTIRNFLLLGLIVAILYLAARRKVSQV